MLLWVAPAVAKAAIEDGVARKPIDLEGYRERLQRLQSRRQQVMATVFEKARKTVKRIALNDGEDLASCRRRRRSRRTGFCDPILLGDKVAIERQIVEHRLEDELKGVRSWIPRRRRTPSVTPRRTGRSDSGAGSPLVGAGAHEQRGYFGP